MSKEPRKTTIYDIATAAGTSAPTVSLVLGGSWRNYRISESTANRVLAKAEELGYSVNLRARGLRLSKSGLAGMIVPHYRNRFFAGLAEAFEIQARERGLCPVVVSTQRDPKTEIEAVETLVSHQVEFLFVAGVNNPVQVNRLCNSAGVRSINIDLPGSEAPSAISDNRAAAQELTRRLIERVGRSQEPDFFFVGGDETDNSTRERTQGVHDAFKSFGFSVAAKAFNYCGYSPSATAAEITGLIEKRDGDLPQAIFTNGITALEGLMMVRNELSAGKFDKSVIGCFDWDPFAASLRMDITFARQDVEGLITAGFQLLDDFRKGHNPTIRVPVDIRATPGETVRAPA